MPGASPDCAPSGHRSLQVHAGGFNPAIAKKPQAFNAGEPNARTCGGFWLCGVTLPFRGQPLDGGRPFSPATNSTKSSRKKNTKYTTQTQTPAQMASVT